MQYIIDQLAILFIVTNLVILASSRLSICIKAVGIQGILLGLLPIITEIEELKVATLIIAIVAIAVKGIMFPQMLLKAAKRVNAKREVEPFLGYAWSIIGGVAMLALAFWMDNRLVLPKILNKQHVPDLLIPAAFFAILAGLFVTVTRKKALTQILGYLILENGIYAFGVAALPDHPLLMEMGILLDVFVAMSVMGVTIFHINKEFDHIDTDRLSSLRDGNEQERFITSALSEESRSL